MKIYGKYVKQQLEYMDTFVADFETRNDKNTLTSDDFEFFARGIIKLESEYMKAYDNFETMEISEGEYNLLADRRKIFVQKIIDKVDDISLYELIKYLESYQSESNYVAFFVDYLKNALYENIITDGSCVITLNNWGKSKSIFEDAQKICNYYDNNKKILNNNKEEARNKINDFCNLVVENNTLGEVIALISRLKTSDSLVASLLVSGLISKIIRFYYDRNDRSFGKVYSNPEIK